jgi:hypothetical protein
MRRLLAYRTGETTAAAAAETSIFPRNRDIPTTGLKQPHEPCVRKPTYSTVLDRPESKTAGSESSQTRTRMPEIRVRSNLMVPTLVTPCEAPVFQNRLSNKILINFTHLFIIYTVRPRRLHGGRH